jgi:hypothetical protein
MKKIKLFALLLAIGLVILNSSFAVPKTSLKNYWCYGVMNKTWTWPGNWRFTLMNPDCYYIMNWDCVVGWTDCTVCINLWAASIIYDDGCIITLDIPWQDIFVEQSGEFIYEIY